MNSKIFKAPITKVEIDDKNISGPMLFRKLEVWCSTEPLILLWETSFFASAMRDYINNFGQGKKIEIKEGIDWEINFHIIRASIINPDGLFDGVAIIAGTIKNSLEMVDGRSQSIYLLSLNSRSLKGEKTFISAIDLWKTLVSLGLKK